MKKNLLISLFMLFSIHSLISQNLITNGDFSNGNIAPATSGCDFTQTGGSYYITTNPHNIWGWATSFTGNGNFMVVDVPSTIGAVIWKNESLYSATGDFKNAFRASLKGASLSSNNPPKIHFRLTRVIGPRGWWGGYPPSSLDIQDSPVIEITSIGAFNTYSADFTAVSSPSFAMEYATLEIINDQPTWWGNDIAIDDISLVPTGSAVCNYSQPTSSISCVGGDRILNFSTNVTGSSNPGAITWRVVTQTGVGAGGVQGNINLTRTPLMCNRVLAAYDLTFYATAPGCSNSSLGGRYVLTVDDCDACSSGCPNYTEGQQFLHEASSGQNFFAHYSSNGTLFATIDGLALFQPVTRQRLINAGLNATTANCFLNGTDAGRMGVSESEENSTFLPFPNPTEKIVNIPLQNEAGDSYEVNITSIDGKNVWNKSGSAEVQNMILTWDSDSKSSGVTKAGVYVIERMVNGNKKSFKVILQK
jgi:hypothetical protein